MENEVLQQGWQKLTSDTGSEYLYKLIEIRGLDAGMRIVSTAAKLAQQSKLDATTHLSVDAHSVTISLNTASSKPLNDAHYSLARQIDSAIHQRQ